jgi:hypothetical protein
MTEFNERLEGEMKSHENEMLHKIVIRKYGNKPLAERIQYVMATYRQESWSAAELYNKMQELELIGKDTLDDIEKTLRNPGNTFPSAIK